MPHNRDNKQPATIRNGQAKKTERGSSNTSGQKARANSATPESCTSPGTGSPKTGASSRQAESPNQARQTRRERMIRESVFVALKSITDEKTPESVKGADALYLVQLLQNHGRVVTRAVRDFKREEIKDAKEHVDHTARDTAADQCRVTVEHDPGHKGEWGDGSGATITRYRSSHRTDQPRRLEDGEPIEDSEPLITDVDLRHAYSEKGISFLFTQKEERAK